METKNKISIVDLKQEYRFLKKYIHKQLASCLNSQDWILGQKVKELEEEISKYLGVKYTVGVSSGTDALIIGLRALALKLKRKKGFFNENDQIITTPFTFIATAEAIVQAGATPVFVDIDLDTFNIAPEAIKKAITKNTVGILVVHLFGLPAKVEEIKKIAKENKLFFVEDSAQAFGAKFNSKFVGTFSDIGAFSFFPTKNLGAWGDAGLIATDDLRLAEIAKILRNHGQTKKYVSSIIGYNSRLDTIQAAILLAKLNFIDRFNNLRKVIAKKYQNLLKDVKQIKLPSQPSNYEHIYHLYTIRVQKKIRNLLLDFLNNKGIQARIYYPVGLHKMKAFKNAKIFGKLSATEEATKTVISLPIHPFLDDTKINYITENIKNFFKI